MLSASSQIENLALSCPYSSLRSGYLHLSYLLHWLSWILSFLTLGSWFISSESLNVINEFKRKGLIMRKCLFLMNTLLSLAYETHRVSFFLRSDWSIKTFSTHLPGTLGTSAQVPSASLDEKVQFIPLTILNFWKIFSKFCYLFIYRTVW